MEPTEAETKEQTRLQTVIQRRKRKIEKLQQTLRTEEKNVEDAQENLLNLPSQVNQRRAQALGDLDSLGEMFIESWTSRRRGSQWSRGGKKHQKRLIERASEEIKTQEGYDSTLSEIDNEEERTSTAIKQWKFEENLVVCHKQVLSFLETWIGSSMAETVLFYLVPRGAILEYQFLTRSVKRVCSRLVFASEGCFVLSLSATQPVHSSSSSSSSSVQEFKYRYELSPSCFFETESENDDRIDSDDDSCYTDTTMRVHLSLVVSETISKKLGVVSVEKPSSSEGATIGYDDSIVLDENFENHREAFEQEAAQKLGLEIPPLSILFPSTKEQKEHNRQVAAKRWQCYEDVPTSFKLLNPSNANSFDPYNLRVLARYPHFDALLFVLMVRRWRHCFKCPARADPLLAKQAHPKRTKKF